MNPPALLPELARVAVSLAVVLALLAGCARLLARHNGRQRRGRGKGTQVQVLARHGLGRRVALTVVRVGERDYVLGVTDASVSVIDTSPVEPDAEAVIESMPGSAGSAGTQAGPASSRVLSLDQVTARRGLADTVRDWTSRRVAS